MVAELGTQVNNRTGGIHPREPNRRVDEIESLGAQKVRYVDQGSGLDPDDRRQPSGFLIFRFHCCWTFVWNPSA